jgi:RNA polymerase subunit RPABC4/transcription elongation factor Spt4
LLASKSDLPDKVARDERAAKMILTIKCEHCRKDFESEGLERTEFCPHCGRETPVAGHEHSQSPTAAAPAAARLQTSRMMACADCGAAMSRRAGWCPACGSIPFGSTFRLVCFVIVAAAIFDLLRLLIDEIIKAVAS